jgi:adenine phosphoribosyltransferase
MRPYLRRIDTRTTGGRYDVTPLFSDAEAFGALVTDLADSQRDAQPRVVACIDALGFILGAAIARELGLGVVPIRKAGKLPVEADRESFVDYSGQEKALELRRDAIGAGDRVLLVDEWIETGAQIAAAIRLLERRGGVIAGIAAIHMDRNAATEAIRRAYRVRLASWLRSGDERD